MKITTENIMSDESKQVLRQRFNNFETDQDKKDFIEYYRREIWPKFVEDFANIQPLDHLHLHCALTTKPK